MRTASEIRLRLSIWRPATLDDASFLYRSSAAVEDASFSPLEESKLLEQIYAWDAGPHDFLGASTQELGQRIESELLDRFTPHRSPDERSVSHFQRTLSRLLGDPEVLSGTRWSDCQETVSLGTGDELNLRANVTLGVLRHFLWVARVFSQVPRASVLIR